MIARNIPRMLAISEGGTREEIFEAYRILRDAGFEVWGHAEEELTQPRLALPWRDYYGVEEIGEFVHEYGRNGRDH